MNKKQRKHPRSGEQLVPEFRKPQDVIAYHGRKLRDRYDAVRPYSDVKEWR